MRLKVKDKPDSMSIREYVIRLTVASVRPQRFKSRKVIYEFRFCEEGGDN